MEALALKPAAEPAIHAADPARAKRLEESAREFEATFIAAMLKQAGFEKALAANSGPGGEAISSLLVERYAHALAEKGGFNLQQQIFRALSRTDHE